MMKIMSPLKFMFLALFLVASIYASPEPTQRIQVIAMPQSGSACGAGQPATVHCNTLTWTNPAVVVPAGTPNGNCILRSTSSGTEPSTCYATTTIPSGTTFPFGGSFIDLNGVPGQQYFYEVEAVAPACGSGGASCNSLPSNETSATFLGNPAAAPTGAAATDH